MNIDIKDMIMADAMNVAIEAERDIIKMKRIIAGLGISAGCLFLIDVFLIICIAI